MTLKQRAGFSRFSFAAIATLALAIPSTAQLTPGDIVVSVTPGVLGLMDYTVIPVAGPAFSIAMLPADAGPTAFEVDPTSGDIIIATADPGGIQIRRLTILGVTVVADTLLTTLVGTGAHAPGYLHREESGGYLLLSRPPVSSPLPQLVHRIGASSTGAVAYQVASLGGAARFTDVAVDPVTNEILLAGPNGGAATQVSSLDFNGANWNANAFVSNQVRAFALEADDLGRRLIAGNHYTIFNGPNLHCSAAGLASMMAVGQTCVDMHADRPTGRLLACFNGGVFPTVDAFTLTCSATWTGVLFTAPSGSAFGKLSVFSPQAEYGYPRETLIGSVPVASVVAAPTIGGAWVVDLAGMTGQNPIPLAFFSMGFADAAVDMTPSGFDRCAIFTSAAASVALGVIGGASQQVVPIPFDPGLIGLDLFGQWAGIDGVTATQSNAVTSTVM